MSETTADTIRMAAEFFRFTMPAKSTIELRALGTKNGKPLVLSGRFDNAEDLARNAVAVQKKGYADNVYFTINPVKPGATHIGHPIINKVDVNCRTTRDTDVLHRRLILVDVDPVRDGGCATEHEKQAAWKVMQNVISFLREHGWGEPVLVDSGNGYHAYYRAEDGCGPDSPSIMYVLKGLARRFNTPEAKVDTSVHNAARISRLVGTWNRKGDNTPERPHRLCQVISYPERWEPVTASQQYRLLEEGYLGTVQRKGAQHGSKLPDLVEDPDEAILAFAAENPEHIDIVDTIEQGDRTLYVLRECPFAGRAHRGKLGKTCITLTDTAVGFSCFSDDCAHHTFSDLRRHIEKVTGRKSKVRFYAGLSAEERAEREFDDFMERKQHNVQFRADIHYDQETWDQAPHVTTTDATEYGLGFASLKESFWPWAIRREAELTGEKLSAHIHAVSDAVDSEDVQAMGCLMGAYDLFWAYRELNRPPMKLSEATLVQLERWEVKDREKRENKVLTVLEMKHFVDTYEPNPDPSSTSTSSLP